ncbi:biopolymer transporter ExbD [Rhodobacteraceae bacterium 2376]|uniref:Biopolymer transporter ExbD n=1 Tax=Rhabdonatronobacter sediminivivens TaxID=2743469 RepID=A0A7Z0I182_9RHOB|nr:biopolymer transporter ExbD [Rhabdonatronobacter sediminivivens]NYS26070.1 biopolymer transporter ExbD [Rhabdonatronobacter sediminivivens]
MRLALPQPPRALISLVPLVDVLLIMLVFFMVTSTYLDLDMIPAAERSEDAAAPMPAQAAPGGAGMLLIRLAPDGRPWLRGQALDAGALAAALDAHRRAGPDAAVSVLASPRADVQALVTLMDAVNDAGLTRLRVLRTEGVP